MFYYLIINFDDSQDRLNLNNSLSAHYRLRDKMLKAIENCTEELHLSDLTIKADISDSQVVDSCNRLLQLVRPETTKTGSPDESLNFDLTGLHLCLANSFSVSTDGQLRIPWDFKVS